MLPLWPAGFELLGERHGLPALPVRQVVLPRSRTSAGAPAADAMEARVVQTPARR